MVGVNKKKLSDILKKAEDKKETTKPVAKPMGAKVSSTIKPTGSAGVGADSYRKAKLGAKLSEEDTLKKLAVSKEDILKKQVEFLHSKSHQDLINAAYKAAEKLKIAPWVLLRAAGWGHFTDDRGKKYDGKAIDEIEGLTPEQKAALKEVLEIK